MTAQDLIRDLCTAAALGAVVSSATIELLRHLVRDDVRINLTITRKAKWELVLGVTCVSALIWVPVAAAVRFLFLLF